MRNDSLQQVTISAVLFDYGLVLTGPPHAPAWERMKQLLRCDEAAFHAAYWRPRHDYDRGALNGTAYWQTVAGNLGRELTASEVATLVEADTELWTQPNDAMIRWAGALQETGVRTGILSNLGDEMETGVRAHCPWLAAFDHLTFSHTLGIAKPDPEIYLHAARGLDVAPQQILFIDDREDNIAAARAVGMHAVQYTDHLAFEHTIEALGLASLLAPATKVEGQNLHDPIKLT